MSLLLPPSPVGHKQVSYLDKTIREIFDGLNAYDTKCYINERINRPDVFDLAKKQAIALYPIYGWGFGEITVRIVPEYKVQDGARQKKVTIEVLDGGHRTRAIREFLNDVFILPVDAGTVEIDDVVYEVAGKYYSDLDAPVRKAYLKYVVMYETYESTLGDFEAGVVFNWKNRSSDINAIENLNAIQTSVVAFLRETSRDLDDGLPSEFEKHDLFKSKVLPRKQFPTGEIIVEDDSRMRFMFIMANIFSWYHMYVDSKGKISMNSRGSWKWDDVMIMVNEESEAWDADDKYKARRIKELTDLLDLLRKVLNAFNSHSKKIKAEFQLLRFVMIFYYSMLAKYGKKNVSIDASKFGAFLNKVVSELNNKNQELAYKDYKGDNSDDTRKDIAWKILRAVLKQSDTRAHKSLDIAFDGSPTFKRAIEDPKFLQEMGVRVAPKPASDSVKEELYLRQGGNDAVDGAYCKLEDMDYAHTDIPSSAGIGEGAVTSENANSLVWKVWNNRMGQSTIDEYRNSEDYARHSHMTEARLQEYGMR